MISLKWSSGTECEDIKKASFKLADATKALCRALKCKNDDLGETLSFAT